MKPRVFVSSVVEGFSEFREAARAGIEAVGGEPLLVNEDFPSLATSSRNACLDAVDSCDYLISIVGQRGGWEAPGGKLVVEEEYEHAVTRKMPVLVFLQDVERDALAVRFATRLSDYVDGVFRRTFCAPQELRREIEAALQPLLIEAPTNPTMTHDRPNYFEDPYTVQGITLSRFVLMPERREEVLDPVRLGSEQFRRRVNEIGHSSEVQLLTYELPKKSEIVGNDLVITQTSGNGRHGEGEHVRIRMTERGDIVIDANVTGRVTRGLPYSSVNMMCVAAEDIETVLKLCFAFAAGFYDDVDPYKRHQRFGYNVALNGLDYRMIVRNPQERASYPMSMRDRGPILAFDEARDASRADLRNPAAEIQRIITRLTRQADR